LEHFCMLLRRAGLTASAGLSCDTIPARDGRTDRHVAITITHASIASRRYDSNCWVLTFEVLISDNVIENKKAELSLTNPRDAKSCQNCSNSTCLQRCRWQYWLIFMRLTAIASEIRTIPRNSLKILTYGDQGHPRSSILVPIESHMW